MSTPEFDKEMLKLDRVTRVHELFKSLGSTDEQAIAASATLAPRFEWTGSVLNLDGKPATAEAVKEHFATNYSFLLPSPTATKDALPTVDQALLASARAGNLTAKSRLFVAVGRDQTKLDAVMTGKKSAADDKGATDDASKLAKSHKGTNPWGAGWNVTEQGRIYKSNPALAASLAASANSRIGATKPTPKVA